MKCIIVFSKPGRKRSFYTGRRDDRERPVIVTDPDCGLIYHTNGCAKNDYLNHAVPLAVRLGAFVTVSPVEMEREIIAARKRKVSA